MSIKLTASEAIAEIKKLAKPKRAKLLARFFKTGPGEYGHGDIFWGLTVPKVRIVAKKFVGLPLPEVQKLLKNKIHEVRLAALIILVKQFPQNPEKIFKLYLKNTRQINNWDLIDLSAPQIVGAHLFRCHSDRSGGIPFVNHALTKLAHSNNLWEKRIAILATFYFIKQGRPSEALKIAKLLLSDNHDLIHKAVGWMLREVGKNCSEKVLVKFLKDNFHQLPRTTLRYAIERFPAGRRKGMLRGKFGNVLL